MTGLIDCRSPNPEDGWAGTSPEMLEFFDRPLLQHAVEQMVQSGVTHCVLLTENTSAVMQRWGTGERWGCTFSAIQPSAITSFLVQLLTASDQRIMVGRGDCIPVLTASAAPATPATQLIFRESSNPGTRTRIFTGWAITQASKLLENFFPTQGADGLLKIASADAVQVKLCIRSDSPGVFLYSQQLVLEAIRSSVIIHSVELQAGVWSARNATIHPSVRVNGKIYLGENVRIARNVTLNGPLVIARDSIIDTGATLTDSSIQPATYVGRDMKLENDIALPGSLIRAQQGIKVTIDDPRMLSSTANSLWTHIKGILRYR